MTTTHLDRELLRTCRLFTDLPKARRDQLIRASTTRSIEAGDLLLRAGEAGRDVYVVLTGSLEVLDGGGRVIARLGSGEVVGERAMLNGGKRNATVRAARDSRVAHIPEAAMRQLLDEHPASMRRLAEILADRTSALPAPAPVSCTRIAVTAGSRVALRPLVRRLAAALRPFGPVAVVDAARVDAEVGPLASHAPIGHHLATATSAWLGRVEADHRWVLLVADGHRRWSAACARQAHLNLVVAAGAPAGGATIPRAARVVVVRDGGAPVPGVAGAWHALAEPARVHHVDVSSLTDVDRLARAVAGRSTGLVLGGGGARGLAHVGVLRALDDLGVPIDAVGGTSIGALAAALYAQGHDPDERERKAIAGLVETKRLIGWTLPVLSMSSAKRVTEMLRSEELFGETAIEDLPLPFFAVSASFRSGTPVVHDAGPLWLAARASISLPGVLPPVCVDGDLLVDGGVVNNVPVDVMRERVQGQVLAVNLRGGAPASRPFDFEPSISGWRVLASRLPGRTAIRLPNPAATMLRAKELGGKQLHHDRLAMADLVIEPPVGDVSNLDFKRGRPLVASAYDHARRSLESWLAQEELVGAANR